MVPAALGAACTGAIQKALLVHRASNAAPLPSMRSLDFFDTFTSSSCNPDLPLWGIAADPVSRAGGVTYVSSAPLLLSIHSTRIVGGGSCPAPRQPRFARQLSNHMTGPPDNCGRS